MTKITVRYLIHGSQVDEIETELSDQAQARELIRQSKRDLCEAASDITRDAPALASESLRQLRLERELNERMGKKD
jgi:hypothetical protein